MLDRRTLIPVLDVIDTDKQSLASSMKMINEYRSRNGGPVAVCCRSTPYRSLTGDQRLRVAMVVELLPPSRDEVTGLLLDLDSATGRSALEVDRSDKAWWRIICSPLVLALIVRISHHAPDVQVYSEGSSSDRRRHLINQYVQVALTSGPAVRRRYPDGQTIRWLAWLAFKMRKNQKIEFRPDRADFNWLYESAKRATVAMSHGVTLPCLSVSAVCGASMILAWSLLHLPYVLYVSYFIFGMASITAMGMASSFHSDDVEGRNEIKATKYTRGNWRLVVALGVPIGCIYLALGVGESTGLPDLAVAWFVPFLGLVMLPMPIQVDDRDIAKLPLAELRRSGYSGLRTALVAAVLHAIIVPALVGAGNFLNYIIIASVLAWRSLLRFGRKMVEGRQMAARRR